MAKNVYKINASFVAAIDALEKDLSRDAKLCNDSELARKLKVTPGLVHAWRYGRTDPTPRRAVQLARLESAAHGAVLGDVTIKKWLSFARPISSEQLKSLLDEERVIPVAGLEGLVQETLEPLMSFGIRKEDQLLDMAVCRLSQRAAELRRTTFLKDFRSGTIAFVWSGRDLATVCKHLESDEFAAWMGELLSPPKGGDIQGFGSKSSEINVVGCIMLNSKVDEAGKETLNKLSSALSAKACGGAATGRFSVYLESETTPISHDYWFYNGPGTLRGTMTLDSPDLRKLIEENGSDFLKEKKYKFSNLNFELSQKQVEHLIEHYRLYREKGRLVPRSEGRDEIFPRKTENKQTE